MQPLAWYHNFIFVALLAARCCAATSGSGTESTQQPSFSAAEVVYEEARTLARINVANDRPILSVLINGAGPFRMLLDTNARAIVLDDRVVRDAALTTLRKFEDSDLIPQGAESADLVRVRSLSIGETEFRRFDAIAVDLDALVFGRKRYDGTLPLSFFSGELFTLDFPGAQVIIEKGELPPPDGTTVLAYTGVNGWPVVKLTLADLSVDVAIDTTNRMACTFPLDLKEQVARAYGQVIGEKRTGPARKVNESTAGRLRIGRHEVFYPPFVIRPGPASIGGMILQHFAVTFDQKNHRVRFARQERTPINFSFLPKYGFELERRGNKMFVLAIFPDSPMDKSYIKVGHRIVLIDRRPVFDYHPSALRALLEKSDALSFELKVMGAGLLISVRAVPRW